MTGINTWLRRNLPLLFDQKNTMQAMEIPIFPIHSVLFPGGSLPLRVFEQRYMEMTRNCLREEKPFGVCLVRGGNEAGETAIPEPVGCLARISDWNMPRSDVLNLEIVGLQRFSIQHRQSGKDGLITATVTPIAAEPAQPIPPSLRACVTVLQRIVEQVGENSFHPPLQFEDAAWVGYRLAERLPLKLRVKQSMLEMNDSTMRLRILQDFLVRQGLAV